ncbi:MAG: protein-glutamate O-methyltransferase CheR [Thaumarchaeota archaeon]|nr:protein-glutamate O-methyltransferase CheR [Nitrososphaerota archaeon]
MTTNKLVSNVTVSEHFRQDTVLATIVRKIFGANATAFGYNESFLLRRLNIRMQVVGAKSYSDYLKMLNKDPLEVAKLKGALSINVTGFYRDPSVFSLVRSQIIPQILSNRTIRVWSAGCASGEEPYSISILLAEILGPKLKEYRVKISATDINQSALEFAQKGVYQEKSLKNLDTKMWEKYFVKNCDGYAVKEEVKSQVSFATYDLQQDELPLGAKFDIVFCRNVMIYFTKKAQERMLKMFHRALSDTTGYLILGKVESA